jgi:hypothetical protein
MFLRFFYGIEITPIGCILYYHFNLFVLLAFYYVLLTLSGG